jgi:hypothetical protein
VDSGASAASGPAAAAADADGGWIEVDPLVARVLDIAAEEVLDAAAPRRATAGAGPAAAGDEGGSNFTALLRTCFRAIGGGADGQLRAPPRWLTDTAAGTADADDADNDADVGALSDVDADGPTAALAAAVRRVQVLSKPLTSLYLAPT